MVGMDQGVGRDRDVEPAGAQPASAQPAPVEAAVSKVLAEIEEKLYQKPFANRWSFSIRADGGLIEEVYDAVIRRLAGHPDFEVTKIEIDYSKGSMSMAISERKPGQEASKLPTSGVPTLKEIRESDRAREWLERRARGLCEGALAIFDIPKWSADSSNHEFIHPIDNAELAQALAPVISGYIKRKNYQLHFEIRRVSSYDNRSSQEPVLSALYVCLRSTAKSPS